MSASDRARDFAQSIASLLVTVPSDDPKQPNRPVPADHPSRVYGLQRLATAFLASAGFDQGGEPVDGGDRGVLDPPEGLGWLGVEPRLRAVAEEHCSPRQLEVMRLAADGLGTRAIGRRLGIDKKAVQIYLGRAGATLTKRTSETQGCSPTVTIGRGDDIAAPHDGVGQDEPTETPILCGPRSPEGDPMRVRHVPFFPARDRPDLTMGDTSAAAGYWTTLPQNPRDIAWEPATIRGADDESHPDVAQAPPVSDFYPDLGFDEVDARRVLRTMVGDRPVVTVQSANESSAEHAARHRRRVDAWLKLPRRASLTFSRRAVAPRARLLPNAG